MGQITEWEKALAGALYSGGHYVVHYGIIQAVGLERANVLHYLFNFHQYLRHEERRSGKQLLVGGDWFFCTVKRMETWLGLTADRQTRMLAALEDDGYIECKKMGLPARRHVRINYQKVAQAISDWKEPAPGNPVSSDPGNPATSSNRNPATSTPGNPATYSKTKESKPRGSKTRRGGNSRVAPLSLQTTDFDRQAAGRLREVLVAHDSDLAAPPRAVRIDTLTRSMMKLRTSGRKTATESNIRKVIKWLRSHYSDEFTPKMHKADDLFTKWEQFYRAYQGTAAESEPVPVPDEDKSVCRRVIQRLKEVGELEPEDMAGEINLVGRKDVLRAIRDIGLSSDDVDWELLMSGRY